MAQPNLEGLLNEDRYHSTEESTDSGLEVYTEPENGDDALFNSILSSMAVEARSEDPVGARYLEEIDVYRRTAIIETASDLTDNLPGSILTGGKALRLLYEAKTGERMFGVGSDEYDILVQPSEMKDMLGSLGNDSTVEVIHGWGGSGNQALRLLHRGETVNIIGSDKISEGTSELVFLDGRGISVQSINAQIIDKLSLMHSTDMLDGLSQPEQNKHGFYAHRLIEMMDIVPGEVDSGMITEVWGSRWYQLLTDMAKSGGYGMYSSSSPRIATYRRSLVEFNNLQNGVAKLASDLTCELQAYFDNLIDNGKSISVFISDTAPSVTFGHEDLIEDIALTSTDRASFIGRLTKSLEDIGAIDSLRWRIEKEVSGISSINRRYA